MYSIICHFVMHIIKKIFATWGLEPASPFSVNRHAMLSTIIQHTVLLSFGLDESFFGVSHDVKNNINK